MADTQASTQHQIHGALIRQAHAAGARAAGMSGVPWPVVQGLARSAYAKGFHRSVAMGYQPLVAARACGLTPAEYRAASLGFSLRKIARGAVNLAKKGVTAPTRAAISVAKKTGQLAVKAAVVPTKLAAKATALALRKSLYVAATPIRMAFNKVVDQAMRNRRMSRPQAVAFVSNALKQKGGPFGLTVAKFATISGLPPRIEMAGVGIGYDVMGFAPAAILAAVPPALILIQKVLDMVKAPPAAQQAPQQAARMVEQVQDMVPQAEEAYAQFQQIPQQYADQAQQAQDYGQQYADQASAYADQYGGTEGVNIDGLLYGRSWR